MMENSNFSKRLAAVGHSLETFRQKFKAREEGDFSLVHQEVEALFQSSTDASLSCEDLAQLRALGAQLEDITSEVQAVLGSLQAESVEQTHRSQGLRAYARQKITTEGSV